jgi:hypothetical protein
MASSVENRIPLTFAGLEQAEIGHRDPDPIGELGQRHLASREHDVESDFDGHQFCFP